MKLQPWTAPGRAFRHTPLALLCALTVALAACSSDEPRRPGVVVQKTVEPLLAGMPVFLGAGRPQLPPLREPMPAPWAAAPSLRPGAAAAPAIAGIAAVVLDEASGAVLYDKDAHMAAAPASLTKIATLILALEDGRLDEWVETDIDSTAMRGARSWACCPATASPCATCSTA